MCIRVIFCLRLIQHRFLRPSMCTERFIFYVWTLQSCKSVGSSLIIPYALPNCIYFFPRKKRGVMVFGRKPTHHHTSGCIYCKIFLSLFFFRCVFPQQHGAIHTFACERLPIRDPPRQHILFVPKTDFGSVCLYCGDMYIFALLYPNLNLTGYVQNRTYRSWVKIILKNRRTEWL